jgi:hypothetical protein
MTRIRRRQQPSDAMPLSGLNQSLKHHPSDLGLVATLVAIAGYLGLSQPDILVTALLTGAIATALGLMNRSAQMMLGWGLPLQRWHLVSGVIAISALVGLGAVDPVAAQMFNNLENAVNDAVSNTGGTTIAPETIATIFNIFRILIVLAFLIGVVIVFTQATRGGDWQPIANLLAIGIAFVIGVEVISTLIIGGGGTTTP